MGKKPPWNVLSLWRTGRSLLTKNWFIRALGRILLHAKEGGAHCDHQLSPLGDSLPYLPLFGLVGVGSGGFRHLPTRSLTEFISFGLLQPSAATGAVVGGLCMCSSVSGFQSEKYSILILKNPFPHFIEIMFLCRLNMVGTLLPPHLSFLSRIRYFCNCLWLAGIG